jgi:hypothetical protein
MNPMNGPFTGKHEHLRASSAGAAPDGNGRYSREAREAAREPRWNDPAFVEAQRVRQRCVGWNE